MPCNLYPRLRGEGTRETRGQRGRREQRERRKKKLTGIGLFLTLKVRKGQGEKADFSWF
jgi:hypothetical protein